MIRIHRYAAGLLAIAVMLTIANKDALAVTRETPLQTAQRIEALTAGGYDDPTSTPASALALRDTAVPQRDARLR